MVKNDVYGWAFLSLCLVFMGRAAYGNEIYSIDNQPLFLYKTINWWYDSPLKESKILCGKPIRCINSGNAQVVYDEPNGSMSVTVKDGFATMLSAFKKCKTCYGPSDIQCTWLNGRYFKHNTSVFLLNDSGAIKGITFRHIDKEQARHIQSIAHNLQLILEGVIGGLSSGQIALHESGLLLKTCDVHPEVQQANYPITLKLIDTQSTAALAIFKAVWGR